MDNSKVRKLYDAMSAKYNMTQPYEEFESLLNDEGKRRKVYDAMSAIYNMTQSFDEFNNSLMGNTVDEAVQSNQESINSITPAVGQEAVSPFQADSSYLTDEDRQTIADTAKMSFKEAKRLGQAAMGIAGQRPTADSSQAAADFINTNREAAMQQEETQKLNQQRKTEAAQPITEGFHELSEVYKDQAKTFREESKQLEKDYYALTQAARDYATSKFGPQPKKLDSKEGWGKAYMEYLENNDPNKVYERYNNQGERSSRNNTISFLEHMANQTERRARQTLHQAERGVVGNTIAGVGYGLSQPQSWSLGMSDLWTAENMISLANKLKDGKQLTDYEQAALDAYGTYQEAASILHEYDTRGFKAGVTTGEMAPFMVQMAWNPAGKFGTTLAQKGVRKAVMNAAKGSSREAAEAVAEQAMKDYGTMATRDLLRNYGVDGAMARIPIAVRKMGGDLAASAVLANTLQVGSTLNNIAERKYGAPVLDGEHYTFDPEQEKSWAEAAYKGELSSIIENFTEMMGEWRVLGLADKMSNFGTKGVGRLVRAMGDTDFAKGLGKVLQDAHWSGTIGEMLEEEYGIILNSLLTGDSKISDLWDLDQQIDIFLGVGLFGGVMGGAKIAAYPLAYVNSKKKLDEVTNYNQDNIADWAKIQDAIDNADNNGLAGIIGSTLRDREEGTDNGRAEAILNYIDALQHFRGVTIARDMLPADADMKTMQAFYLQGYDGTDKQAISAAYQHRKSQMELTNPGITAILDSEGIDVTIKDENGNIVPLFEGQYRQMALDYLDAKAAYDGMLDGITDRAQSKARAAEVIVRSNDNNGQQIEATTRTGDKVHIISGDVIMADGVANLDQSSKSIVIRHEDGTKEMVSPLFIKSIDLTTDTESAAAMAAQSAAQESVMTESQEAEIPDADAGMQAMADNRLGQQRGIEQADYQIGDEVTLPDGTVGRVNLGIGQTEDGTVEVVWNTPDGNKVGRYTADQLYDMQHPEGTTAAAAQTEQVEATQENTELTPQQKAYDEWVAKHGDNALNKLNQTRAYAEKELAARQKELNKIQSELNDLPDVEDEAITKKKAELEKKQTELQSAIGNYSVTLDRMNAIQSVYDAQNQESTAEQKDDAIRNRAAEWEKNTGVKVIILERPEDVPNEIARQKIQAGENVKGWFEKGQVYVYLPNNTGAQDFDQTFIHEVIAHKGLKEMLGTQLYAKLCRQVWDQLMTEEQKQEYLALVSHVEGEQAQQLAAADEFIAYFAEKMTLNPTAEDMTTWQQFVKMLTELLNKVFGTKVTEQDLSELLIDSLTRYQMQVKSQEAKVKPKKAPKKKVKKVNKPTDFQNMRKAIEDVIDEMDFETQMRYAASKLGNSIVWGNDPNTGTKGLGSHIVATKGGASEQDRRKYFAWEKSRRNGGKYPEEIAESIMANMPESLTEGYDTRDALRIILDAITGSSSPSDVVHQVYDDLIARQEAAEREEEERQQYTYAKERGFGSYEELVIFDANEDLMPLSEEEWQQYYNSYYGEGTDGSSTQGVQGVVQQPAGQSENLSGGNEVGSEQRSAEQVPSNGRTEAQESSNPVLPGTEGETGVIQGLEGYSLQDIQDIILNHIADVFQVEFPEGFQINGIGIIGSRANGTAREDSDLDVLLEYEGDISEDSLYNMLNGENGLEIESIKVDINPITPGKSGTIQEFLERNNDYKKEGQIDKSIANAANPLSAENADVFLQNMKGGATPIEIEAFTEDKWKQAFPNNTVDSPIGKIKIGENQKTKLIGKKRANQFGLIKPTLESPDVILYEEDLFPPEGTERTGKLLFVKTFKINGKEITHFESVTVRLEGLEINVSNHIVNENALKGKLQQNKIVYIKEKLLPNSSESRLAERQSDVPDLVPTQGNSSSESKDTQSSESPNENGENNELTDAQVKALAFVTGKSEEEIRAQQGSLPYDAKGEKTLYHPATLRAAYESGNAADIAKAEKAVGDYIMSSNSIERLDYTAREFTARKKQTEKGSAEYRMDDFCEKKCRERIKQLNSQVKYNQEIPFDLSNIPDTIKIKRINLQYYQILEDGRINADIALWVENGKPYIRLAGNGHKKFAVANGYRYENATAHTRPSVFIPVTEKNFGKAYRLAQSANNGTWEKAAKLDAEYVKAVKSGDIDKALDMLRKKALTTEGITGYVAPNAYSGSHRDVAKLIKTGKSDAVQKAAADMARFVPGNAVLVPIPSHEGMVTDETDTKILADAVAEITGSPVVIALEGNPRESRYQAKQQGKEGLKADELGFRQIAEIPEGKVPVFIDNVVDSGETAKAASEAIKGGFTMAYAKGVRSNPTRGLKNMTVTYDDNGNLIPLSERFNSESDDIRFREATNGDTDVRFRIGDNEQTHELNAKQKQPGEEAKVAAEAITADIIPFESSPVTKEEIAAARDTNLVKQWKRSKNGDLTRMFGSIPGFVRDFAEATLGIDNKYGLDGRVFYHAAEEMDYIMDYAREHGLDVAIADKHNFKDGETIGRLIEEAKPLYTEKELTEIKKVLPEGAIEALNGALQAFADEKRIKEEMERIRALNDGKTMENALTLYAVVYNRLKENYEGDDRYFHTLGRNITDNPRRVINEDISKEILRRIATAPVKAYLALEDMSDAVDDIRFRLSNNNHKVITSWLNKRTDLTEAEKAAVLNDIYNLEDAKTQLATGWWFAKGAIRLPEDMPKVEQAVAVSTIAKVDPLKYSSPMELINAHADIQVKDKPINPDEVSTLHKYRELPDGIVVYDVDDSEESRKNMRAIIDTHFGKESSPWCLLQGDGEGNLTEQSKDYWDYYNSYPKQVAFKDGKLLAFSANNGPRRWWDRMDKSHEGIPVEGKMPGDKLGRSAVMEYDPVDGTATVVGDMWKGNPDNGPFETYYDTGELRSRSTRKNHEDVGLVEKWHKNGQKSAEFTNNELGRTDGPAKTWHANGQLSGQGRFRNGYTEGVWESWYENGQKKLREVYPEDILSVSPENRYNRVGPYEEWYENGNKKQYVPIGEDGRVNGTVTNWFEDGTKESEEVRVDSNTRSFIRWFQSGDLEKKQEWDEDGHKTGTWESYRWDWDSNKSVLQERTTYKNGSKNGPDEEYYPNGNIKIRVNFKDGRAEGLTESWNEDGKPFLRLVRIDGKEIGHEYYDYDNNEVVQLYTIRDGAGIEHNYVRRFPMEGYKPLTEEELSTYPDWAREEILADQTMFRVGEEQLNLFSPEDMNGGIAGSQKNINFASNKKSNERGESDIQREGSSDGANTTGRREDGISQTATSEPAQQSAESVIKPLRKLEEGETCHVERKLSEAGDFSFIGKDKIETIEDVAFIFRKLETKAVENAFIAFVKNGKATILHVGMGSIAASLVDLTPVTVMMKNINPDKVYFIHNHPSGQLTSSNPDRQLWRAMKSIMGDKLAPGIIIDSTKGEFGIFEGDAGFNYTEEFTENSKGEQQIPVYRFDERVFSKDYDPESSQIRTSRDIAAFVAGHRLGERDKISVLCLDHGARVLGNFFLPYTDLSSIDAIKKIAVDSAYYAGMCGATAIVLYGNGVEPSSTNLPSLAVRTLKEFFAHNQLALLDIVGCYRDDTGYYYSYADHGYVAEPEMEYGKQEALKQAEAETDTNPSERQKEAGNYKKGHVRLFGMDLSIEQPRGSVRSGTDADGKQWSQEIQNTYGYIRGTMGRDKDHIDVFLGDNLNSDKVFVVDQRNVKDGSFDEHKVMLGFDDIDAARKAYESNYEKGWRGMAAITETTLDDFKEWAFADGRRVQPFSQLVKTNQAGSTRKTDAAYAEYDRTRAHGIIAQSVNDDATLEDINKLLDENKEGSPEYDVYNTIYTLAASGLSVREAKDTVINESANAIESIAERRMEQDLAPVMEPLTQLAGVSFRISREPSRVRSEYNNGDIVVYNPKSAADVQAAVMRESYTHKDIRNVPGWDILTDVAYRLSEGEIASKAVRGNMDFEAATEEWMYENAERMVAPFEVMMSRNRVNLLYRMTGDEIRMYLTKSDGLLGDAELFVTKEELPVEESIRFRRGSSTPPSSAQQLYDASQQSLANKFYRAYVDYTKPLRDVQEIIAKESGTPIQDFENAWEAENQRPSKSKNEIEQFELRYFEKIREAVRTLEQKTGMTYNEVLNYLIAKHGLERNVVLAQRDAEADYRDYLKEQPGGPKTVNDFFLKRRKRDYSGLTDLSGKKDVADAEDYARTLVQTVESMASRETDALWQTIKDAVEVIQKKRYQSGMISREQMQKEADMFDNYIPLRGFAETIAEDVYDYYEDKMRNRPQYSRRAAGRSSLADDPLATLGAMAASAIMQGNNNLMKQRFLNMVENHKTDIATIKDVWVVNHGTPSAPVWEPEYPDVHEGMDADDIRVEIERYTNRMQQMQRVGLARKATNRLNIKWRTLGQQAKQHIITVRRNGEEQMIIINGNPQVARTVNGLNNPDATLTDAERYWRSILRFMAANFTTRNPAFMAANLCRDLGFAVLAVSAKENAAYRHQFMKNITGPVIKTTKIGKLLRKWQAGTLDVNNELERYFGEFMDNGGETGYTAENTVDAFRKKMMKGLKDKSKAIKAAEATLEFFELCNRSVEDLTRFTAYMTSRQMGRTVQRSVADAKNITVNFNRKGSGEMLQKYIASGYLFFNAGVQSLQNVAKISGIELSMDEAKGKARIKIDGKKLGKSAALLFGSQVIMGMVFPMLNEFMMGLWGGDDDDKAAVDEDGGVISTNPYRRLTEYERRNNLCLWIGGNRFIKIPLAIELRAFYGLGETIYGYMAGIPNPNPGADILTQIADLLPVNFVENNGLVPDAAAPLWQSFITNENFMGIPLYNDSEYLKNEPEANKVYSNTGDAYIALSRWINELGGGDEVSKSKLDGKWNNPAVMQNIVEGYLGGLLTTSRQTANLIGQPIKKFILGKDVEPIPARDWPVVNRLYINTNKRNDDRYIKERYYNYRDQAEKVRHDIREYEERLDDPKFMEKYQQLLESPEYLDYITFDALNKAVKDAHQDVKEYGDEFKVFETDAMRELVNAMDEDAEAVMQPEQWGRTLSGKDKNISE